MSGVGVNQSSPDDQEVGGDARPIQPPQSQRGPQGHGDPAGRQGEHELPHEPAQGILIVPGLFLLGHGVVPGDEKGPLPLGEQDAQPDKQSCHRQFRKQQSHGISLPVLFHAHSAFCIPAFCIPAFCIVPYPFIIFFKASLMTCSRVRASRSTPFRARLISPWE